MGIDLKKIEDVSSSAVSSKKEQKISFFEREVGGVSKMTNRQKERFYTELGVLLDAHVPLKDAILSIVASQKKKTVRKRYDSIASELIAGKQFSEIMKQFPGVQPYEWVILQIGEETGFLETIVTTLGTFFKRKNETRSQLLTALLYPAMILFTSVAVMIFMLFTIVPMFEDIFRQNQIELPAITQLVLNTSYFMKAYGLFVLVGGVAMVMIVRLVMKKNQYKIVVDKILLKVPLIGRFLKLTYLSQFLQAMTLLLMAKVTLVKSLGLSKAMISFFPLKQAIEEMEEGVLSGNSLTQAMQETSFFDRAMLSFVKVGEQSNQLTSIFERLFDQYQKILIENSKKLTTLMEPLLILLVGGMVAIILISMYLPMFRMSSVLG